MIKLDREIVPVRYKSDGNVEPLPQGKASELPDGLLKSNGSLAPSGATSTIEGSWPTVGTRK
jgi:hypothetical protein